MRIRFLIKLLLFPAISLFLSACGSQTGGSSNFDSLGSNCGANVNVAGALGGGTPAVPFCTTQSYPGGNTITGSAGYQYRANGNGAVTGPNPIRYAEVRAENGSGTVIQCGETDASGNFSIVLPNDSATYTIYVASRSNGSQVKATVMNNPTSYQTHTISTSVVSDSPKSVGTLTAPATGSLEGGAFHIFDQILNANEYLRTETTNCNLTFPECTPFTVAPNVNVFWAPGVNPLTYFGLSGELSFYSKDSDSLWLLGGVGGDIDNSDTDHFDTTIILHEYGHFLEDQYSIPNSPGGLHIGDMILDPRLAFSEAWANYFQASVTGVAQYRDTSGTIAGTPLAFVENLETSTNDQTTVSGEGNFREFAITRALVDITDTSNEGPGIDQSSGSFAEIWTVFSATDVGIANPNLCFRDTGLFWLQQQQVTNRTDWSEILTAERQIASRRDYANSLTLQSASCSGGAISMQAANASLVIQENGSFDNSNHYDSNDFYQLVHPGGPVTIELNYSTTPTAPADLDLYLYRAGFRLGVSPVSFSTTSHPFGQDLGSESINLVGLAAGTYLINIHINTVARLGAPANYNLTIDGQNACPN